MERSSGDHQPPSPSASSVHLKDCLEELLQFTLSSSIDGTLGLDIGLSKKYCSNLLMSDPDACGTDFTKGVLAYPLYKGLAVALYQCVSSGSFCRPYEEMAVITEDNSVKQLEDKWMELVRDKGSELQNVLKSVDFELHVQEPFFSQLKGGLKTVEGRCAVGDYNRIVCGNLILFNKRLVLQVQDVHRYASFFEMLESEGLNAVLPGIKTTEEGVQIYRKFYSEEKEGSNGVLAICVTKPAGQPYLSLASILSGLGYAGIQKLLGFAHTVGTTPEALPSPRSALLSSFLLPHNPNVKGSTLTDGARALAKHVNRSSSKYWGALCGSVYRFP